MANLTRVSNGLCSYPQSWVAARTPMSAINPQDGLALGRLLKEVVLDPLANLQKMFYRPHQRSESDLRVYNIYRDALTAFVTHLDRNFYYLCRNPKNPDAQRRIERIFGEASFCALNPNDEVPGVFALQKRILEPLKGKIAALRDPSLKNAIRKKLSPILFSEKDLDEAKTEDLKQWNLSANPDAQLDLATLNQRIDEIFDRCHGEAYVLFSKTFGRILQPRSIYLRDFSDTLGYTFREDMNGEGHDDGFSVGPASDSEVDRLLESKLEEKVGDVQWPKSIDLRDLDGTLGYAFREDLNGEGHDDGIPFGP